MSNAVVETLVDTSYVASVRGVIGLGEMLSGVCAIICASVWSGSGLVEPAAGWCMFVTIMSLIMTVILYMANIFKVRKKLLDKVKQWGVVELALYAGMAAGHLSCGLTAAILGEKKPAIAATSFFTFLCAVLYGIDVFFSYRVVGPSVFSGSSSSGANNSANNEPPSTAY